MFLKKLQIKNKEGVIREIFFKKGVNLIVDETPESQQLQATGNNVGKTTLYRNRGFFDQDRSFADP